MLYNYLSLIHHIIYDRFFKLYITLLMALDYNFYIKLFILPTIQEAFFQYFMHRENINHQQI